ncbi:MAG: hypothetical protein ACI9HK_001025 [Pirellulaceae bacterium]|jgi:uncharacterized protein (DUF58 family)
MREFNEFYNPEIVGQIAAAGLSVHQFMEGPISGQHRSPLQGVSPEFADYRSYSPGDDLRNLDWRVYARSDRFYIKRFEEESNLRAHVVLDASASMNYGTEPSKFEYAATLGVALAATLLKQRDAVGLTTFNIVGKNHLKLSSAETQLNQICQSLSQVEPGEETELGQVVSQLADQIGRRSLIIVISDLFTDLDSLYDAMGKVQYGGHEMIVFHVLDRAEVELPFNQSVIFKDIEGAEELYAEPRSFRSAYQDAMREFMEEVEKRCLYCGIDYLSIFTDQDMGLLVSRFLHQRTRMGPKRHRGRMTNLK